jgi:hypothetical protein
VLALDCVSSSEESEGSGLILSAALVLPLPSPLPLPPVRGAEAARYSFVELPAGPETAYELPSFRPLGTGAVLWWAFLPDLAARGDLSSAAVGLEAGALLPPPPAGCFLARGLAGVLRGFFSAGVVPDSSVSAAAPRFWGLARVVAGVALAKFSFFLIWPKRTWWMIV